MGDLQNKIRRFHYEIQNNNKTYNDIIGTAEIDFNPENDHVDVCSDVMMKLRDDHNYPIINSYFDIMQDDEESWRTVRDHVKETLKAYQSDKNTIFDINDEDILRILYIFSILQESCLKARIGGRVKHVKCASKSTRKVVGAAKKPARSKKPASAVSRLMKLLSSIAGPRMAPKRVFASRKTASPTRKMAARKPMSAKTASRKPASPKTAARKSASPKRSAASPRPKTAPPKRSKAKASAKRSKAAPKK
jgi:hypothetical protein